MKSSTSVQKRNLFSNSGINLVENTVVQRSEITHFHFSPEKQAAARNGLVNQLAVISDEHLA